MVRNNQLEKIEKELARNRSETSLLQSGLEAFSRDFLEKVKQPTVESRMPEDGEETSRVRKV